MVAGNGAHVVHTQLQRALKNYTIGDIPAWQTLFPPMLGKYRRDADIIHTAPDFASPFLGDRSRSVLTFHNYYLDREVSRYATVSQRIFYQTILRHTITSSVQKADIITTVGDFVYRMVRDHLGCKKKLIVIKNGVDVDAFTPRKKHQGNHCRILFVGNVTRRKGAQLFEYIANGLPANCELAFTSGLRKPLRASATPLIRKALDSGRLCALGRIAHHEMPAIYHSADMLFFPTYREGLGLAAVEAMACGLPVVTTRCSALPEVVDEDKGGYLCAIGDGESMLKRITQLVENPSLRQQMGEYNREKVLNEFRLDRMIADYQAVFEQLS